MPKLWLLNVKPFLDPQTRQWATGFALLNIFINLFIQGSESIPISSTWQKHLAEEKLLIIFLCTASFLAQLVGCVGVALQHPFCLLVHLITVWLLVLVPYLFRAGTVLFHNQVLLALFLYNQLLALQLTLLYCIPLKEVQAAVDKVLKLFGFRQEPSFEAPCMIELDLLQEVAPGVYEVCNRF